jgi:hypothetical protein
MGIAPLTCSARRGLQAAAAQPPRRMRRETAASPPNPSPADAGEGSVQRAARGGLE